MNSFTDLTPDEARYRLENYYKVVTVRNPMERLLSAYRNKLEPHLQYESSDTFPDSVKLRVLRAFQSDELTEWLAGNRSTDIHPSFESFLKYMTQYPLKSYNDHFQPVVDVCHPCTIGFDFYVNVKVLDYDIYAIMEYLGIPIEYYPGQKDHPVSERRSLLSQYFKDIPSDLKQNLFKAFSRELDFYYTLYPEDFGRHALL